MGWLPDCGRVHGYKAKALTWQRFSKPTNQTLYIDNDATETNYGLYYDSETWLDNMLWNRLDNDATKTSHRLDNDATKTSHRLDNDDATKTSHTLDITMLQVLGQVTDEIQS